MISFQQISSRVWNIVLFLSIIFATFILPAFPPYWHRSIFRLAYTIIYIAAIFSLNRKSRPMILLVCSTILAEWVSGIFDLPWLSTTSKVINICFFILIVALLLHQIATAKRVNEEIILGSMIGYLLIGIIFSIFIGVIIQHDPTAFNSASSDVPAAGNDANLSTTLYFSFVTLATLGYGDVVPLKPYTRSLATLMAVVGQFYIAIIVALLVGKFSAQTRPSAE